MTRLGDDWFLEKTPFDAGTKLGVKVKRKLFEKRTAFQFLEVYDTERLGRMLVLDGVIQVTEFDEFGYHEMFAHVPMNVHPDPRSVLVVGGGDGGVVRELIKYDTLEEIHLCEIDGDVIQASREFLPFTSSGLDDPRVKVFVEDGNEFLADRRSVYDLILVDSSDPIGPADVLFKRPFFERLKAALKEGGAAITQCETIYLFLPLVREVIQLVRDLFPRTQYMNILMPTYPSGMIGQLVCSCGPDFSRPVREITKEIQDSLQYYTPAIHRSAFSLPRFAERALFGSDI
jgi:spermidine synthase